jgi:hypothetical protein
MYTGPAVTESVLMQPMTRKFEEKLSSGLILLPGCGLQLV